MINRIEKDIIAFCKITGKELSETEKINMKINILISSYEKEIESLKFENESLRKRIKNNQEIINKIKETLGVENI